jgi:hypothetical protein
MIQDFVPEMFGIYEPFAARGICLCGSTNQEQDLFLWLRQSGTIFVLVAPPIRNKTCFRGSTNQEQD